MDPNAGKGFVGNREPQNHVFEIGLAFFLLLGLAFGASASYRGPQIRESGVQSRLVQNDLVPVRTSFK